jgi:hypothetical protein
MPSWWSGNGVGELLTPVGDVVPVLGAGVGRDAGLPDARQLAEWLADEVTLAGAPSNRSDLFQVVDAVAPSELSVDAMKQKVAAYIESFALRPTPFLDELVRLPSRFIITFNYDDLVGFVAEQQGLTVRRLSARNPDDRREARRLLVTRESSPPGELTVFHLHGQARAPETLVLDQASYSELTRCRDIYDIVFTLAYRHTLAFVGTVLNEIYLLDKLQELLDAPFHVVFCHQDEMDELTTGRAALTARQHLRVVGYPDYRDLIVLPRWLNAPQPPRGARTIAITLDPSVEPDAAAYVTSEFEDRAAPAVTVSEDDIQAGQRTIVVGVAGSGKTHLVSWLAVNAPAERPAVRVRLADVPIKPGSPERVLAAWARHARSSSGQPAINVSGSALNQERLHFLLDGLDEVANELQETAASLIGQVAERFPQHAFTVMSRPLPTLAVLGYGEPAEATPWRFVDLVPGAAWQQRYLADRGVALEQLEATMPALTDMRELLQIPFFLTRTVELLQNGQLEGLRDVGELLGRLVDFALTREQDLLPMVGLNEVRSWLRRVALAAAIAGRRTFTFAELQQVQVTDDLAGDLSTLVQQLQLRLLLSEEDGRLRFSHRLIADQLTAEALAATEPSEALLDTLVPVVDEQLAGVRDDVVIAVSLLCLRSTAWRAAVARRDPMAAARSTPSDADPAERAAAIDLLLRTYDEWRIWAWNRSTPDLVEDTEVIARLLRHDPDGAQVADVRRMVHAGDEIQQGNAIRILARVAPPGLTGDLRRVLRDPARNDVVIRQAAIAAADLGLTELIDDIIFAMLASDESVVHQDGSIALRELTPNDRLLEVAERLAPCRDGMLFNAMVRERMRPDERIKLARTLALAGADVLGDDRADLAVAADKVRARAEIVQSAAVAAVLWHDESAEVKALLEQDPQAAARGMLEARDHGADWWGLARLASHADLDMLRAAGVDERVMRGAEQARELQAMSAEERAEMRRTIEADMARERERWQTQHPSPPTLAQLLRQRASDSDPTLQTEAFNLQGQVKALADDDLRELRTRLASWWPTHPFKDLIRVDGSHITLVAPAGAWLLYAPAACMAVTDDQWAQFASQPFIYSEQSEWLRLQATEARMRHAVALMTETRVRAWQRLLDCCTAPPPAFVVEACAAVVEADPDESHDTTYLMQRLAAGGITEAVRAWSARDEIAAHALRPMLALEGDLDAQRQLLDELLHAIRESPAQAGDGLGWMAALRAPEFLGALFEILETLYPRSSDERPRSGWSRHDVLTPTIEAIATVGTREAVQRYDALLARGDDLRWLRAQRDRIAASVLRAQGEAVAAIAAADAGVPLLPQTALS